MFQRQSPQPFPVRNVIFLAIFVVAALVFLLKNMQPISPGPPPAPPAPTSDSARIEVRIDSLAR